ncbi:hypothetical protein A2875_04055 [Candidatus Gottesmanbacteria bacterium RIFCSPHIGHO2_01_FULL_46_14]|uniref:Uncharacterized protein n=2 Tax=Candidatus Gottesmaniibacteriota TaxID=1752720 RepID=A0A1F5ZN24_9BACT|nr:MAG: hypothetical protein A2875_04055 [Candidatus Gottesmanbacteria bacterium RIFCSPHIGHO2_01_FULL_46_14]OGG29884.1 MAG: hypothetical protein A2971_05105 [Candidatus Gottesmanbacteria bacterium RIFCSPLOWO2_01_FULL_46_21]
MNEKKLFVILGVVIGGAILLVGGWYVYFTSPAFRRVAAPVVLRAASLGSVKPKLLSPNQEALVRLVGILEKTPQATVSFYRLVGPDWSIGLDVSQVRGISMKDATGSVVTVEGVQKRLQFIQKSPSGGPDSMSEPHEGSIVFVSKLSY